VTTDVGYLTHYYWMRRSINYQNICQRSECKSHVALHLSIAFNASSRRIRTPFLTTMSIVQPPAKVLVSGANGFVAVWVVQTLLERGYAVRGTIRSGEKGLYLRNIFKKYGDMFELAVVADITQVRI
jgi:NADPH:quinone reductase-like Zn-dependent oxidoreductase